MMGITTIDKNTVNEGFQAALNALGYLMEDEKFIISVSDNGNCWLISKRSGMVTVKKISDMSNELKPGIYDALTKIEVK